MQDTKFLAFEKNNGVDVINITVDTDESWSYKLDVKYPEKCCTGGKLYDIIDINRDGDICSVELTSKMLPFAGKYIMQLRAINGDKVKHSDTFDAWIKYSIEPASTYNPVPSEFYQIEQNITEINNHPPYPDISGFWMIWNPQTHKYELSDIPVPTEGGGDKTYVFTQATASDTWEIKHNLYKYPSVSIADSGDNIVYGDVQYIDINTCVCHFSAPFSGKAYLN